MKTDYYLLQTLKHYMMIVSRTMSLYLFCLVVFLCPYVNGFFRFTKASVRSLLCDTKTSFKTDPTADLYQHLKFSIMGGGAFSLALAQVLSKKNIQSTLLVRNQSIAEYINTHRRHPSYLSEYTLPKQLRATTDSKEALEHADYVIHAVPMQQSRVFLQSIQPHLTPTTPLLSVTKGVEQGTFCLMNEIIVQTLGSSQRCAFLSGPSFAEEIMQRQATAVVIASTEASLAKQLSLILSSIEFRCHTSSDVKGVELAGAIKNVIALAAGMCEGLDLGMNAMSSLVTRGCLEMSSMGKLFGADQETFNGLAGVGDTFGTCFGPLSRNR
ncbi:NAD(P)-dependent glycerol-3-phosphate dehydrogenase [archaeon]|nr:MAG: NAD(P)-dependent glycerol-3-phosphate dehydrogenase [archaeon]